MYKKYLFTGLLILLVFTCVFISGCDKNIKHEIITYTDWEVVKLPTFDEEGSIKRISSIGEEIVCNIPVLNSGKYTVETIKEATFENTGIDKYTIEMYGKECYFQIVTKVLEDKYGEPVYVWSKNCTVCYALRRSLTDERRTMKCKALRVEIKVMDPTFETNGATIYVPIFDKDWANEGVDKNKIIYDIEKYTLTYIEPIIPTCLVNGRKAYYKGSNGINYEDENHEIIIEDIDSWGVIDKLSHDLEFIARVEPTSNTCGRKAYYKCKRCNKCFEDKYATNEIIDIELWSLIPKL